VIDGEPMKIVRFIPKGGNEPVYGVLQSETTAELINGDIRGNYQTTGQTAEIKKLLVPVEPSMICAIGLNFAEHAAEFNLPIPDYPVLFMKAPSAIQNPGDPIEIPTHLASHQVDYEAELVVIIRKECKNATPENALDYVLGYTCGNDVSARDWQKEFGGSQWCRGKSFATFAPLGPCLVTPDEIPNPQNLKLSSTVNGELRQSSTTANHIFSVRDLIVFLSGSTILPAGTAIFTGTPSGAGLARNPQVYLKEGVEVTIEIEGIGKLTNPVVEEVLKC
jgi:2-keto-4-pentenoate hydratase/2-oxohepta-3-ene-1,7-dioic acid hydratase in catechol pathway